MSGHVVGRQVRRAWVPKLDEAIAREVRYRIDPESPAAHHDDELARADRVFHESESETLRRQDLREWLQDAGSLTREKQRSRQPVWSPDGFKSGRCLGRYLDIWNTGRTDALGEILSGDYRGHVYGSVRDERDQIALAAYITAFRAGLPDARFEIQMQFGAADCLATRLTMTSGQSVAHGMNISRFTSRRLTEEWAIWEPA